MMMPNLPDLRAPRGNPTGSAFCLMLLCRCSTSGSLAKLAAMRRASSRVSKCAGPAAVIAPRTCDATNSRLAVQLSKVENCGRDHILTTHVGIFCLCRRRDCLVLSRRES